MHAERISSMNQPHLAKALRPLDPPAGLSERICARVVRAEVRRARIEFCLLSSLSFLSTLALVPALRYAAGEFYISGFGEYLSLALSSRDFFFAHLGELLYSLLESLPSLAVLCIVVALAVLLWSLARAVASGRRAFFVPQRLA